MEKFKAIRIFLKVVEAKSFAQAAGLLELTPSAVSKSVSALESDLGVQLLKRSTRSLNLTPDGKVYYERCRQLSDEYDDVEATLRGAYQTPKGRLRVDFPMIVARFIVSPALPDFLQRYPDLQLELSVNDRPIDLIREGYDAVIRIGTLKDSNLLIQPLSTIQLSTYASPIYLTERGTPQTPEDLLQHNCLPYIYQPSGKSAEWLFERQGRKFSLEVAGNFSSNDPAALIDAAVAGIGVHQTASFAITQQLSTGALVPILASYRTTGLPVSLLYPSAPYLSAKLQLLIAFVKEQFQRLNPLA